MVISAGGGQGGLPVLRIEEVKMSKKIVLEDIELIKRKVTIDVPVLVPVPMEQIKYETKVEKQVKYDTQVKDTIKYNVTEQDTTRYNVTDQDTIRYKVIEVKVEKPIMVDKPYEKPVIKEVEYVVATIKDLSVVRDLMELIPKMTEEIKELKKQLDGLTNYTLVEKEIDVPKINYVPTEVERIIWKDVVRTRPV